MILVDSHCHIDGEQFDEDRDEVIARALAAGVGTMLNVGTGDPHSDDLLRAVRVADRYPNVYAAVGVHPHDAKLYDDDAESSLVELVNSSRKVIAWGEIGLDFHYDHSPRDVQDQVFRRQIRVARRLGFPIVVHSREADVETVKILKDEFSDNESAKRCGSGILHCFGGSPEMIGELLPLGFLVSFAGNVTFKNAENLREAARAVPLDRLLIETDCPYLTPMPHRGRRNEPGFVLDTAKFLADLYGIKIEELAHATTENFFDLFQIGP